MLGRWKKQNLDMTESKKNLIKELAEGHSKQSKIANQFWLVLMISSVIAFAGNAGANNRYNLPFTLGEVSASDFYFISLILISITTIAFTSAMIQAIRARMLIQKVIDSLTEKERYVEEIHIQDYLDSILTPTYNRVAPISQYLLGKNQFFGNGKQNKFLKSIGAIFYIILKLLTFGFIYIIPLLAINKCLVYLKDNINNGIIHIHNSILYSLVFISLICILILFVGDIKYILRALRRIKK